MKLLFFLLLGLPGFSATRYFSTTSGNFTASNGTSPASSQTIGTPWRCAGAATLDSVLSGQLGSMAPGDIFLLKSGDTFFGTFSPTTSGTAGHNMIIGSYNGTVKPVLSTFQKITSTSWTSLGGNKYESPNLGSSQVRSLKIDGKFVNIGRWPDESATAPYGYLAFSCPGTSGDYITAPNWGSLTKPAGITTGGEVAVRLNRFRFDIYPMNVTFGSAGDAKFQFPKSDATVNGFGYYIQNNPATLSKHGEWCWNPASSTVTVYLSTPPANYTIEATTRQRTVDMSGANYYEFQNLAMVGGNENTFYKSSGNDVTVNQCSLKYGYQNTISANSVDNFAVQSSIVDSALTFGITVKNGTGDNSSLLDNGVKNTMPVLGMGQTTVWQGSGINLFGSDHLAQYNTVQNSAYAGINANQGGNWQIKNNKIIDACNRISDGGYFYTVNQCDPDLIFTNRFFSENILISNNNETSYIGTFTNEALTMGFYADQWSNTINVTNNTFINMRTAIFFNDPWNMTVTGNTVYNWAGNQASAIQIFNQKEAGSTVKYGWCNPIISHPAIPITGMNVQNNVMFMPGSNTSKAIFFTKRSSGQTYVPTGWGTFNNNFVVYPLQATSASLFKYQVGNDGSPGWKTTTYTKPQWTTFAGYESATKLAPKYSTVATDVQLLYNDTKATRIFPLNGWKYLGGDWQAYNSNEISVAPFRSAALIKNGAYTGDLGNVLPTISLDNPVNNFSTDAPASITLKATAGDTDGSITKVEYWDGLNKLFTKTTAPYDQPWTAIPAGTYNIKAIAYDNGGGVKESAVSKVIINNVIIVDPKGKPGNIRVKTKFSKARIK